MRLKLGIKEHKDACMKKKLGKVCHRRACMDPSTLREETPVLTNGVNYCEGGAAHTSYITTILHLRANQDIRWSYWIAGGLYRIAGGLYRIARGLYQIAGGLYRIARGLYRIAGGLYRIARGLYQIAGGLYRIARGLYRIAGGLNSQYMHFTPLS